MARSMGSKGARRMEAVVKVEEVAVSVSRPMRERDRPVFVALNQVIAMFMIREI